MDKPIENKMETPAGNKMDKMGLPICKGCNREVPKGIELCRLCRAEEEGQ